MAHHQLAPLHHIRQSSLPAPADLAYEARRIDLRNAAFLKFLQRFEANTSEAVFLEMEICHAVPLRHCRGLSRSLISTFQQLLHCCLTKCTESPEFYDASGDRYILFLSIFQCHRIQASLHLLNMYGLISGDVHSYLGLVSHTVHSKPIYSK